MSTHVGKRNSSLTRVQPIFDELLDQWSDGDPWLSELWDMAALTRPGVALSKPVGLGKLLASETPPARAARQGTVYERPVAPPAAFLRWLLENPQKMKVRDPRNFGAKSDNARCWRSKLFSGDKRLVSEAQNEGRSQLGRRLAQRGRNKWWAFEGFSRIDCCLITSQCVLFVEGKRTESVSPSTLWFQQRSQLWRAASSPAVALTHLHFKFSKCHTQRRVDLGGRRRRRVRLSPSLRCHPPARALRTEAHVLLI